jgi:hypothetical protein
VCACVASICAHVGLRLCLPDDAFPNVSARDGRKYFPPAVPMLLAWSMGFRVRGTFVNYLGYVRTGCLVAGCSVQAFSDPAGQRAKMSIDDSVDFERRPPMLLQQPLVRALVLLGRERPEFATHSMLFLCTYVFLLRLPSEALPLLAHGGSFSLWLRGMLRTAVSWYYPLGDGRTSLGEAACPWVVGARRTKTLALSMCCSRGLSSCRRRRSCFQAFRLVEPWPRCVRCW